MAAAFFIAGGALAALAFGMMPTDPARFEAPRWVIASAGVMFMAAGFVPLGLGCGFPQPVNQLAGLIAALGLGAILNWIAFFPGTRHFSTTTSLLDAQVGTHSAGQATGRILFGLCALLVDALVAVGLWRMVRSLAGRDHDKGRMR